MILKEHEIPANLIKLQSYKNRVSTEHHEYDRLLRLLHRERAGYQGEKSIDYQLSKLDFKHTICHYLRLPHENYRFQIDSLLKATRLFYTLEVKNLPGIVSFDTTTNKMIRTLNGQVEYYDDPVIQVEEQKFQLEAWLKLHGYPHIPIEPLVVMAHPDTILKIDPSQTEHLSKVIPLHNLSRKLREISEKYSKEIFTFSQLIKVGQQMISEHDPAPVTIHRKLNIKQHDFIQGVICPECGAKPISWKKRKWECWSCGGRFPDAHIYALKDYYLLMDNKINKKKYADFMGVKNMRTASYHLNKLNHKKFGHTHQLYHLLDYSYQKDFQYLFELDGYK
ncbi:NERD domain-containing protein [Bacillaceae bacterium W0354]